MLMLGCGLGCSIVCLFPRSPITVFCNINWLIHFVTNQFSYPEFKDLDPEFQDVSLWLSEGRIESKFSALNKKKKAMGSKFYEYHDDAYIRKTLVECTSCPQVADDTAMEEV